MATASTTGPLTIYKPAAGDNVKTHETGTGASGYNHANLDNINAAFNATTGHDHDGTDSKKIASTDLSDTPFHATTGHDHDGTDSKLVAVLAANVFIGDTANAKNTAGLTINQGAADDEAISLKSSDVAHGVTTIAETDTYGFLDKSQAAGAGGLRISGLANAGSNAAVQVRAYQGAAADTTKSAAGLGVIRLTALLKDGTGANFIGANGNLVSIDNAGLTRFIFDAEGSAHADVEWTTFDDHDDLALLNALDAAMTKDPVKTAFGRYLSDFREQLQAAGIVNFYDPEGPRAMVNTTRLLMLVVGTIRQLGQRWADTERRMAMMEQRLAMLPEPR